MTRRGRYAARVAALKFAQTVVRKTGTGVTLIFACTELSVTTPGGDFPLARADALKVSGVTACTLAVRAGQGACYFIEIAAEGRGLMGGARPQAPGA